MSKTALITGANKGLGLETARQLARDHDFTVYLGCRDQTRVAKKPNTLLQSEGLDACFVQLDVTDLASIADAAASSIDSHSMF